MNYPKFKEGDVVSRNRRLLPRTVQSSERVAGTYRYALLTESGHVERDVFEHELRRGRR